MKHFVARILSTNTRFKITILGMLLVTLFAWRAGWAEGLFSTFCTAITALSGVYVGPHTYETLKNNAKPPQDPPA